MWAHVCKLCTSDLSSWSIVHLRPILRYRRLFKISLTARKNQYYMIFVCRSLGGNDRNDKQKNRVKSSEKSRNSEQKRSPSLKDSPEDSETELLWWIPTVQSCKSLASSSNHDFAWQSGVTRCVIVRLLIAQFCNIKKSSVVLLLNMHIIVSSWQMLHFQCLIIRFYRFSLILLKRKNNYMSPHFMPLSVWNFWPLGRTFEAVEICSKCPLQFAVYSVSC